VSESIRTWGLRLLALGIAIGLWFGVSFEDREEMSERLIEASVSYDRPRGYVILDQVQSVAVRVRGSSKQVRQLNPYMVDVQVELPQAPEGIVTIDLGPENVLMPEGLQVISIEPNLIRVELEKEVSQRIPVMADIVGKAAAGAKVDEPEVFPNQVLVAGPESLLEKTEVLHTRPVNIDGRTSTFEETVAVLPPDPLIQIVQPTKVSVRVPIQPPGNQSQTRNGARSAPTEGP
jgi:YbbR domain-containing protein